MKIFKDTTRQIAPMDIWVCIHEGYLYIGETPDDLLWILANEWEHDKHLVG